MTLTRRRFVYTALATPGTLIVGFGLGDRHGLAATADPAAYRTPYLHVTSDNRFLLLFDKAEMGQGVLTGQATLFGEEADIAPTRFETAPAPVADVYGTVAGFQVTGGSTSTADRWTVLRQAGAAYRQAVIAAAARQWGASPETVATDDGFVMHGPTGARLPYAAFNAVLAGLELSDDPPLKRPDQYKYIGKLAVSLDAEDKSTGRAAYGVDFHIDSLRVAVVVRSPVFGGRLAFVDEPALRALPYVRDVKVVSTGVAIVCDRFWQCLEVKKQIDPASIRWEIEDELKINSDRLFQEYSAALEHTPPAVAAGEQAVSAVYDVPFLTHSPLEPQNAAAWRQKDRFDVWAPTQSPTHIRNTAAALAGMPREQVHVHTSKYLGGGFGRRGANDFAFEAVELASQVTYPVKVMWTREDDMQASPMRPMAVHRIDATLKAGKVSAWRHQLACQSIAGDIVPPVAGAVMPEWVPKALRGGVETTVRGLTDAFSLMFMEKEGAEPVYNIPTELLTEKMSLAVPTLYWRSVGHSINGFVLESFLDEVSAALGRDPVELRLELLEKTPRAQAVVRLASSMAGWANARPTPTRGLGFAYHKSFGTHAAQCADVEVNGSNGTGIRVHRVFCAVDCGTVVNPHIVAAQVRSGIVFGLTAALYGRITFKDGVIEQTNFDTYRLLAAGEMPEIVVQTVPSDRPPSGIGEPGVPPIAAAVGNAIYRITGRRLRRLPFSLLS